MIISTVAAQRRGLVVLALTLAIGGTRFATQSYAAGAFAIGKCGAFGQAYITTVRLARSLGSRRVSIQTWRAPKW